MNNKQFIPHYDRLTCCWKVDFPDGASEIGDLLYVSCEYLRTCLYFPYDTTQTMGKEYHGHSHSFDGVLQALYGDPAGFSIKGHEDSYSLQERELLEQLQKKLNHLFVKGIYNDILKAGREYKVEQHIGAEVLDDIAAFIKAHGGARKERTP